MKYKLLGLSLVACLLLALALLSATGLNNEEAGPSYDRDVVKDAAIIVTPFYEEQNGSSQCRPGCIFDPATNLCECPFV